MRTNSATARKVSKYYSIEFLDKNMYVSMTLLLVFYSLWAVDPSSDGLLYLTIPLIIALFMAYSLAVEKRSSSGDPVDVLSSSRTLIILAVIYVIATVGIVYLP